MKTIFASLFFFFAAINSHAGDIQLGANSCRILYPAGSETKIAKVLEAIKSRGIVAIENDGKNTIPFNDFIFNLKKQTTPTEKEIFELSAATTTTASTPIWTGSLDQFAHSLSNTRCYDLNELAKKSYETFAFIPRFRARLNSFNNSHRIAPGISDLLVQYESLRNSQWWDFPERVKLANDQYQFLLKTLQTAWDVNGKRSYFDRLDKVREQLIWVMASVCPENARMTDLLNGGCGNGEAQSLLVTSLFLDMKTTPEPGFYLALQVFNEHIRPVIFTTAKDDSSKKVIVDLVYGGIENGLRGDLYSPELISFAFLFERGAADKRERNGLLYGNTDLFKIDPWLGVSNFFEFQGREVLNNTYLNFGPTLSYFSSEAPSKKATVFFQPIRRTSDTKSENTTTSTEEGSPQEDSSGSPTSTDTTNSSDVPDAGGVPESQLDKEVQQAAPVGAGRFGSWLEQNGLKGSVSAPKGDGETNDDTTASNMSYDFDTSDLAQDDFREGDVYLRKIRVRQQAPNENIEFTDGLDFKIVPTDPDVKDNEVRPDGIKVVNPKGDIIFKNGSDLAAQWKSMKTQEQYYALKDQIDFQLYTLMKKPEFRRLTEIYGNFMLAAGVYENELNSLRAFQYELSNLLATGKNVEANVFRNYSNLEERDSYWEDMAQQPSVDSKWISATQYYRDYKDQFSHPAAEILSEAYKNYYVSIPKTDNAEKTLLGFDSSSRYRFLRFFVAVAPMHPLALIEYDHQEFIPKMLAGMSELERVRLSSPLIYLFEKIVLSGEYSVDPAGYVPIAKENVVMVEVEGGKWQPQPKTEDAPSVSATTKPNDSKKENENLSSAYADKIIPRDLALGLTLSLHSQFCFHPLVQMKVFTLWDEEMQKAYIGQYADIASTYDTYRNLWSWSPVLVSAKVRSRDESQAYVLMTQAKELGIPFYEKYDQLVSSGKAALLVASWENPMIELLPTSLQALPPYAATTIFEIAKQTLPNVKVELFNYEKIDESKIFLNADNHWSDKLVIDETIFQLKMGVYQEVALYPRKDMKVSVFSGRFNQDMTHVFYRLSEGQLNYVYQVMTLSNNRYLVE